MALDPSNSSSLEQLALNGLTVFIICHFCHLQMWLLLILLVVVVVMSMLCMMLMCNDLC